MQKKLDSLSHLNFCYVQFDQGLGNCYMLNTSPGDLNELAV